MAAKPVEEGRECRFVHRVLDVASPRAARGPEEIAAVDVDRTEVTIATSLHRVDGRRIEGPDVACADDEVVHAFETAALGPDGFCLSGDLFNMFVFFELMSVAAYGLTGYKAEEPGPLQGALNFAVTNSIGALMILSGIALFLWKTRRHLGSLWVHGRSRPRLLDGCSDDVAQREGVKPAR